MLTRLGCVGPYTRCFLLSELTPQVIIVFLKMNFTVFFKVLITSFPIQKKTISFSLSESLLQGIT